MRIYIDESGVFAPSEKYHYFSCVTAIVIPEAIEAELFKEFSKWKERPHISSKKGKNNEVKGSKLNENDFASLIALLTNFDVIVETVCFDTGNICKEVIETKKKAYSDEFEKSNLYQKLKSQFNRNVLFGMSGPQFTQGYALARLMSKAIGISGPYYLQRLPHELTNWGWVIDTKSTSANDYEEVLKHLVKPFVQMDMRNNPPGILEGEDLSIMQDYLIPIEDLKEPFRSEAQANNSLIFSIDKLMKSMFFEQSHDNLGLQLADILASCVGRAMRGTLQFEGWKYMPGLIVLRREQAIEIIRHDSGVHDTDLHTRHFVNYINKYGKTMHVPPQLRGKLRKGFSHWEFQHTFHEERNYVDYRCNYG